MVGAGDEVGPGDAVVVEVDGAVVEGDTVVVVVVVVVVVAAVVVVVGAARANAAPNADGEMRTPTTADSASHFTRRTHRPDPTSTGWPVRSREW